jgi:hypothetical protein
VTGVAYLQRAVQAAAGFGGPGDPQWREELERLMGEPALRRTITIPG